MSLFNLDHLVERIENITAEVTAKNMEVITAAIVKGFEAGAQIIADRMEEMERHRMRASYLFENEEERRV